MGTLYYGDNLEILREHVKDDAVSAEFKKGETPPLDVLKAWIAESYRAIAPKRLVTTLQMLKLMPRKFYSA